MDTKTIGAVKIDVPEIGGGRVPMILVDEPMDGILEATGHVEVTTEVDSHTKAVLWVESVYPYEDRDEVEAYAAHPKVTEWLRKKDPEMDFYDEGCFWEHCEEGDDGCAIFWVVKVVCML